MFKNLVLVLALVYSGNMFADDLTHFEAALDVVSIPQGEQLEEMVQGIVNNQVSANPSIRPIRGAFEIFYREIFQSGRLFMVWPKFRWNCSHTMSF